MQASITTKNDAEWEKVLEYRILKPRQTGRKASCAALSKICGHQTRIHIANKTGGDKQNLYYRQHYD